LATALDLARHRNSGRLDLPVRDPTGLERLQAVIAELHRRLALRITAPAAALVLAELRLLREQHGLRLLLLARRRLARCRLLRSRRGLLGRRLGCFWLRGLARVFGLLLLLRRLRLLSRCRIRRFCNRSGCRLDLRLDDRLFATLG